MGRFRILKNSFLGGQVSKDAVGRTDLPQYAHACELLQNMIPLLSGGAYRRPGTIFQDFITGNPATNGPAGTSTGEESSPPRFFPFIVNQQTAYAIAIGTMRFAKFDGAAHYGGAYMKFYRGTPTLG